MPTELPRRKIAPEPSREGTLFFAVAVVLMLAISVGVALHDQHVDASNAEASTQGQTY